MNETGYPVCCDATHSIQMPTSMETVSGGQREYIPYLVRAATAGGLPSIFMEVHDNPSKVIRSKYCLEFKIFKKNFRTS